MPDVSNLPQPVQDALAAISAAFADTNAKKDTLATATKALQDAQVAVQTAQTACDQAKADFIAKKNLLVNAVNDHLTV